MRTHTHTQAHMATHTLTNHCHNLTQPQGHKPSRGHTQPHAIAGHQDTRPHTGTDTQSHSHTSSHGDRTASHDHSAYPAPHSHMAAKLCMPAHESCIHTSLKLPGQPDHTSAPFTPPLCYWFGGGPGWGVPWAGGQLVRGPAPLSSEQLPWPLHGGKSCLPAETLSLCLGSRPALPLWRTGPALGVQGTQASDSWPGVTQDAKCGHSGAHVPLQPPTCFVVKAPLPNLSEHPSLHL